MLCSSVGELFHILFTIRMFSNMSSYSSFLDFVVSNDSLIPYFSSQLFEAIIFVVHIFQNIKANTTVSMSLFICYLRFEPFYCLCVVFLSWWVISILITIITFYIKTQTHNFTFTLF